MSGLLQRFRQWAAACVADPESSACAPGVDYAQVQRALEKDTAALAVFQEIESLLPWFKTRARGLKGAFAPDDVQRALGYLPGWAFAEGVGLFHPNVTTQGAFEAALRGPRQWTPGDYRNYTVVYPGHEVPGEPDRRGWWAVSREFLDGDGRWTVLVVPTEPKAKKVAVANPALGHIYVASPPEEAVWGAAMRPIYWLDRPAMSVRTYTVTAPSGEAFVVHDRPGPSSDPLTPATFWIWAYKQGLQQAAQQIAPVLERADARRKAQEAEAKGRAVCGICFQIYAVHFGGGMVQHGYQMDMSHATWGHEGAVKAGGDCYGVSEVPWAVSSEPAQRHLALRLRPTLDYRKQTLADWQEGRITTITLVVSQRFDPRLRVFVVDKTRKIGPSDPEWPQEYETEVRRAQAQVREAERAVQFFERAIAGWPALPQRTGA